MRHLKLRVLIPLAALAVLVLPGLAAADSVIVRNLSGSDQTVYFRAVGCFGVEDHWTGVCGSRTVKAGQTYEYTWAGGTSSRAIAASCMGNGLTADVSNSIWNVQNKDITILPGCGANYSLTSSERGATSFVVVSGLWGTWRPYVECPDGKFANRAQLRVESDQFGGDDSALNSVALGCSDSSIELVSHEGWWGSWGEWKSCPAGTYITGARVRSEPNMHERDDSAANDVELSCSDGKTNLAGFSNGGKWGEWSPWKKCAATHVVCGLEIRLEGKQPGDGDDSAMNGLELACCTKPKPKTGTTFTLK